MAGPLHRTRAPRRLPPSGSAAWAALTAALVWRARRSYAGAARGRSGRTNTCWTCPAGSAPGRSSTSRCRTPWSARWAPGSSRSSLAATAWCSTCALARALRTPSAASRRATAASRSPGSVSHRRWCRPPRTLRYQAPTSEPESLGARQPGATRGVLWGSYPPRLGVLPSGTGGCTPSGRGPDPQVLGGGPQCRGGATPNRQWYDPQPVRVRPSERGGGALHKDRTAGPATRPRAPNGGHLGGIFNIDATTLAVAAIPVPRGWSRVSARPW